MQKEKRSGEREGQTEDADAGSQLGEQLDLAQKPAISYTQPAKHASVSKEAGKLRLILPCAVRLCLQRH